MSELNRQEIFDLMDCVREKQHKVNSIARRSKNPDTKNDYEIYNGNLIRLYQKLEKQYYSA